MQRITVIDRQCGAELQITGQPPQISHALVAHAALAVVFIFVQAMALSTGISSIHRNLLDAQPPR
jgi:hypothetical protein